MQTIISHKLKFLDKKSTLSIKCQSSLYLKYISKYHELQYICKLKHTDSVYINIKPETFTILSKSFKEMLNNSNTSFTGHTFLVSV